MSHSQYLGQLWLTLPALLAILAIQLFAIQLCSIAATELCELVSCDTVGNKNDGIPFL